MTETKFNPLQTIIGEFKNISPETVTAFVYRDNGELLAADEKTNPEQIKIVLSALEPIAREAEIIGGIENLTMQSTNFQLSITALSNLHIATISSRSVNQKALDSLTHVLVPTIVNLMERNLQPTEPLTCEMEPVKVKEVAEENLALEAVKPLPGPQQPPSLEPNIPQPTVNQLMVEKIGGLLVPQDTVRIDSQVIAKWIEFYEGKHIATVSVETLDGRTVACKYKAIRDEGNAKGIIQVPEKILLSLQADKGSLVMVRPVID